MLDDQPGFDGEAIPHRGKTRIDLLPARRIDRSQNGMRRAVYFASVLRRSGEAMVVMARSPLSVSAVGHIAWFRASTRTSRSSDGWSSCNRYRRYPASPRV